MPSIKRQAIFVLWGERFDELVAVAFVTRLRKAGLPVKVVGLSRRPAAGAHGVGLMHDLTVEEAVKLTSHVCAVVIPCGRWGVQALIDDPRLHQLLQQACDHRAQIFCTSSGLAVLRALTGGFRDTCPVTLIPPDEHLLSFVDKVSRGYSAS